MTAERPAALPHLFSPLRIGSFEVRNRIVSTAHLTNFANDGLPTVRHLRYWEAKAKGGIGLIITEGSVVHPSAKSPRAHFIELFRDECVPMFKSIASAVHEHGAKIVGQMNHNGTSWRPSHNVRSSEGPGHAMTAEEVHEIIRAFADAASRLQQAGLDGAEVHATHGYLLEQFLSPATNERTDNYGGTEENRLRFLRQIVTEIRQEVGPNFTLGIRATGDQQIEGGLTLADEQRVLKTILADGHLDYVNVSFYGGATRGPVRQSAAPMSSPPGAYVYLAAAMKQITDLPVFCIGRIVDPRHADTIIARGEADMVGMTRANIADPQLPNKARVGAFDTIRTCIGINTGCIGRTTLGEHIGCALNPSIGTHDDERLPPTNTPKSVWIVGGGIAGMEAARVLGERGHHVTLFEQQPELGGQLLIAAKAPTRAELSSPIAYYHRELARLGVIVHLNSRVARDQVEREHPDVVVVATGSVAARPVLPGQDGSASTIEIVAARDAVAGETGQRRHTKAVVFALEQGMESLAAADVLSESGVNVELVMPESSVAAGLEPATRLLMLDRLLSKEVGLHMMSEVRLTPHGVSIAPTSGTGRAEMQGATLVVVGAGGMPADRLYRDLAATEVEVHAIGDCYSPRRIAEATQDAFRVGLAI